SMAHIATSRPTRELLAIKTGISRSLGMITCRFLHPRILSPSSDFSCTRYSRLPIRGDSKSSMDIVIADDDRICAKVLSATLSQWGHSVTVASDGNQAWELLTSLCPPLAILDWMMPGCDGVELC